LQAAGHEVHSVSGGQLAIRQMETTQVDLLVFDSQAPDISGSTCLAGSARICENAYR
jgi:DNA-binding response OmpR family regulator